MSLKQEAIKGVKWTTLSTAVNTVIQFFQLVILARFLSPSDFGLMAIVVLVISFAGAFADMGVSNAIIYRQNITHKQLSSLYWLNILTGILLFFIISALSPLIADFYKEPELIPLLIWVAFSFVISSTGMQYSVLFRKELQFDLLAKISISSSIISFITALGFAINGYGVYALVYANLAMSFTNAILVVWFGREKHIPSFIFSYQEVKGFISFGLFQMGEKIINFFNSQFDTLIIGKILGIQVLGYYTIAKNLTKRVSQIINPIITNVSLPIMSQANNDDELLKRIYLKTINYVSSLNFPIYIAFIILAEPLIMILYGEKWKASIHLVQLLSIYALIRSTGNPVGSLLMAKGKASLAFYWNLALFTFIPLSIYFGSNWGIEGVIYSLVLLQVLLFFPNYKFLIEKLIPTSFKLYAGHIYLPLLLSLITGALGIALMMVLNNYWAQVFVIGISGFMIYCLLSYKFNPEFITALKSFKKNESTSMF